MVRHARLSYIQGSTQWLPVSFSATAKKINTSTVSKVPFRKKEVMLWCNGVSPPGIYFSKGFIDERGKLGGKCEVSQF